MNIHKKFYVTPLNPTRGLLFNVPHVPLQRDHHADHQNLLSIGNSDDPHHSSSPSRDSTKISLQTIDQFKIGSYLNLFFLSLSLESLSLSLSLYNFWTTKIAMIGLAIPIIQKPTCSAFCLQLSSRYQQQNITSKTLSKIYISTMSMYTMKP